MNVVSRSLYVCMAAKMTQQKLNVAVPWDHRSTVCWRWGCVAGYSIRTSYFGGIRGENYKWETQVNSLAGVIGRGFMRFYLVMQLFMDHFIIQSKLINNFISPLPQWPWQWGLHAHTVVMHGHHQHFTWWPSSSKVFMAIVALVERFYYMMELIERMRTAAKEGYQIWWD